MDNDHLLLDGTDNLPKIIYLPNEHLPPPHPEPKLDPPRDFLEAMDDIGDAIIKVCSAFAIALEPVNTWMDENGHIFKEIAQQIEQEKQAPKKRAKYDIENKLRMQRGGKWKAW